MRRTPILRFLLAGIALAASQAVAQSAPPSLAALLPPQSAPHVLALSLDDAIAMAERDSPRLKQSRALVQHAEAQIQTARAYSNPSLEIYAGHQSARPIATPAIPGLLQHYAGYQPIEIPSERRARLHAAQHIAEGSRFAQRGTGLAVTSQVKHAFYDTLRRREEIGYARENLTLVEDLRRRVEVEVKVGEKGRLELTRAEAELARARFDVRSAELEYATAIASLRVAIAAPAGVTLDPQGTLEDRMELPPVEQLRADVLHTHPAVAQSQAEIEAAKSSLDRERAARMPQPTLFAEFENQPDLRYWRAGLTVPLPLFDRRRGQIAAAKASVTQADAVLEQSRLELLGALERSVEQYQLADQQVAALESGSLRAAESAVEAAKAAYRLGERGILEVLDAQRVLQSVRADLVDAQFERQSALVDLEELGAIAPKARP